MKIKMSESKQQRRERWAAGDYTGKSRLDRVFRIISSVPIGDQFDLLYVFDRLPAKQRSVHELGQKIARSPFAVLVGHSRYERVRSSSPLIPEPARPIEPPHTYHTCKHPSSKRQREMWIESCKLNDPDELMELWTR